MIPPPVSTAGAASPANPASASTAASEFIPKRQTRGMFCSRACCWAVTAARGFRSRVSPGSPNCAPRAATPAPRRRRAGSGAWPFATRRSRWSPTTTRATTPSGPNAAATGRSRPTRRPRKPVFYRRQERKPLVLAGHGLRLRIHRGTLVVTHGFTHYPQKAREQRFFPGDPKLPSRIILLSADGSISLDVARWLSEQKVPLVMLDYRGQVVSVLGTETTAADLDLRRAQIEALSNGRGLVLASALIEQKLTASLDTLATLPASAAQESAIDRVASLLQRLRDEPPETIDDLRLLEAWAAISYFAAWRSIELRWKGTGKKPIPPEWRRVGMRQDFLRRANRHARHPVNAMLNYGYAVLESQVRIAIAEVGLDPTIGYLHVCQPGRQALVYDLMEPYRPQVDREVLGFIRSQTFTPRDFVIDAKGVCRLHPELARRLAGESISTIRGASLLESLQGAIGGGSDFE